MTEALGDEELDRLQDYCGDANTLVVIRDDIREFKEDTVLSPREAEAFVMRSHGLQARDISRVVDSSESAAQDALRRARRRIEAAERTVELVDEL